MEPQCYCIEQPRCRLCQFRIENDELVVAAEDDGRVTQVFTFLRGSKFYDEKIDIDFHMCFSIHCSKSATTTECFHSRCYESRFYPVTTTFLSATKYSFSPSIDEERRRAHCIQSHVSQNLQNAIDCPRELPREVWDLIAGYLIEPCAVLTAQEQVHEDKDPDESVLDFTQSVHASFVKIDGRCYVKDLKNTPDATTDTKKVCLVLPALPARQIQEGEREWERRAEKDLFVAMDHIGIRRLVFVSPERCNEWCHNQPSVPGIWWRHIPHEDMHSGALIKRDGLKVRDIQGLLIVPPSLSSCIGWPAPFPTPPAVISATTLEIPFRYPPSLRMRFIDCNAPGTLGYYVATDGMRILNILTHKSGQHLDTSLFEDFGSLPCFWMYMPIDKGEHVTDVCRRARIGRRWVKAKTFGFTFTTNLGRTVDFGFYGQGDFDFRRIAKLAPESCRVYFNVHHSSFRVRCHGELMAFEKHNATSPDDELPKLPVSISDRPQTQNDQDWLYSSCSMSRVTEIYACIDQTAPHRQVIGLLLYYADNHRECVGQFRPDWAAKPIQVGETDKIYIGCKRTEQDLRHVVGVTTCPPAKDAVDSWVQIEQADTLEWWFSSQYSVLCHAGTRLN